MRGPFRPARETHRELTGMVPIRLTRSHDLGLGIGIAHGFATLGTIGFEGRYDYAASGSRPTKAS
jgi:hypothetical protein